MRKLYISILFCLSTLASFGQTDNYGTEFWTAFMSNYSASELRLFIAARNTTDVTISVPLLSYSQKITVLKDSVYIFKVPNSVGQITSSEVVEQTGVHIVSDYAIAVTAMNLQPATTDATVVFPLKNVPVNATYVTGHPGKVSNMAGNEFLIVSTEDGAQVEITPSVKTLKGKAASTPFYITLDKGEVYQVQAENKGILDGSIVRAINGKRIIVYTGDKCSAFPCGACDHQVEQVFPNQLLDTAYYVLPLFGHTKGYTVKVVSIDTTIWVKVNGKPYRIGDMDSALVLDVPIGDSVLHISGPRKFSCFQFMKGPGCNGYVTSGWGDPSILQILSSKYMGQKSTFNAVNSTNLRDHFVSILIPTVSNNDVYLDGSKIPSNEFIPVVDNTNFSYARLKVTLGVHTIVCNKIGHLAYCYGIGNYESYMYTGGFSLPNFEIDIKDSVLSYNCKTNSVTMRFDAKMDGVIKAYHWDFGDNSPQDTVKTVTHSYPIGKDFTIKLVAMGYTGKKDSVIKKYNFKWPEFNPVFDKLLCDETFTYEERNPFFRNFKWHDNSTDSFYTTNKTEKVWVSATDTSGYCKFYDTADITKVDVLSKVKVDTLSNCHLNNLFKFSDSTYVKNDQILYKAWIFPGGTTFYDTTNFYYHFRQPGKFIVYLDIYPVNAACKARIEIPVTVNWNTDIDAFIDKEKYCNGEVATIKDLSYSCCQKVKKYYWEIEGGAKINSDSGTLKTQVYFDYVKETGIRKFNYITETEQGCRDTVKSGLIVWPAAPAKIDLGPVADTIKCLALSRWTFTHNVDESLTGPYTMFWNFGNGKTGTQNQYKNVRYNDTGTYKITLTTTTNIGCVDSFSRYVKAINNAIAGFSIIDSMQCLEGNSIEVADSSKGFALKYKWDFGIGTFSTNAKPTAESYIAPGKYKLKLNVISDFPGCFEDSITHNVTILKHPEAGFKLNADTMCLSNNNIILTDTSKFYNGKYKLYWHYQSIVDSAFSPAAIQYSDTGVFTVKLIAKDSMSCTDTVSNTISIRPGPVVKMSINDTIQCYGVNTFTLQSLQATAVKNRIWTLNDSLIAGADSQKDIINLSPDGFYKVTLIEETLFGCVDSVSRSVEVLPKLMAEFAINRDTQCFKNHSVDLTTSSGVTKDLLKWTTYIENLTIIGTTSYVLNYKFNTTGTKDIKFVIETENGCKDSITHSLHLLTDPVATFQSDSVCVGQSITLTALQTAGAPLTEWAWNMGDGTRYDPITTNYTTHTYKNDGIYYPDLGFKDKYGCYGSYKGAPVLIYGLPDADFTIKVLASDDQYSFVKLLPNRMGHFSYQWSFPDGSTNTIDTPTVHLSRFFKDRISLKVQSVYGCLDTASQFLYIFPALTNLNYENAFTPNFDGLNDCFKPLHIDGAVDYKLRIYNRWGEQIFNTTDPNSCWSGYYNNQPAQAGVYIFTVEFKYADGNRYTAKGNVTVVR